MKIFGVRIDVDTRANLRHVIKNAFHSHQLCLIHTINAEILLKARTQIAYKNILNAGTINTIDAVSVLCALRYYGVNSGERYIGVNVMHDLFAQSQQQRKKVFCVVRSDGLVSWQELNKALLLQYPSLDVVGTDAFPGRDDAHVVDAIKNSGAAVVLCNFGAPEQEFFMHALRTSQLDSVRVACGIGGAFDFVVGRIRRAPLWMQRYGLEWFYRLIQQPRRMKRILNAVIIFPFFVVRQKITDFS